MSTYKPTGQSMILHLQRLPDFDFSSLAHGSVLVHFPFIIVSFWYGNANLFFLEHDGLTKDGKPDSRVGTGEFAHGKVDPVEAGKEGGSTSGSGGDASGDGGSSGGSGQFAGGKVDPVEAGRKGGQS